MRNGRDPMLPEHPAQLLLLKLLAEPIGKQERAGSLHELPCLVKNLQCTTTQRDPVLAVRLRPPGRDSPYTLVPINSLSSLQLPLHGEGSAPINSQQNVISAHILVYGVAVPRHRH